MEGQSCSLPHAYSDFPEPRPTQALVAAPDPRISSHLWLVAIGWGRCECLWWALFWSP